jgi:hypothetical protein
MARKLAIMLLVATAAACVAAPSTAEQPSRAVYVMPGGFVVGLDSGGTAMMSVALELSHQREWLTGVEQERVRGVVDRAVSDMAARHLLSAHGRRDLSARLHREIRATGLPVESVLIPDLAVS